MRIESSGTELVGADHDLRLVRESPLGVQRRFRRAARARREERDREIARPRCRPGDGRACVEQLREPRTRAAQIVGRQPHASVERAEHAVDVGGTGLVVHRRRDRAQPPARPVQQDGLEPVRRLPRDHVTPTDAGGAQASREGGHPSLERGPVEADAGGVVDNEIASRTRRGVGHDRVERRDVPGSTRRQVVARSRVAVRGPERHAPASGFRQPGLTLVAPFTTCEPM